ncbi:succinate dehydrogenase / fumarate reductase cytochrome b subunit [Streptomyces achromogenes]|uniref:Succinate dehydrogenase / fumarate reductase cytochrome b subunit n=1 Tax=Streptomyces achromogenes TaxID=67255 RepID=A0ABU0Q9V5_STRAH|nr:succinate dehydrogenase cytochrome b subunit [Streptomyces achromogenes]MDQ0687389.1 succinate dehydrogenase / fumarate reductase cytochrome b subunit [Streptomyces achromogenes]
MTTAHPLTTARHRVPASRSTVALKAATAISGLIMVLFLLVHMYGDLKVFSGRAAFDDYARYLRTTGEPFLPYSGALWIARVVLLASVLVHIYAAVTLWRRARRATAGRGGWRYQSTRGRGGVQRTYASFTMRWGGVTVALFVIYHLLQLTTNTIHPGGASPSPFDRTVNGFRIWWVVLSYAIALTALGFHLRHGFWSAFATLGANTSVRRRLHLNVAATAVSLVITIGFLVVPFSVLFGWVG